jgi:hypothetical protein
MNETWSPTETTTHQDHVIAHVLGTTVLGFFTTHETVHLLLDIGFLWKVFVDGEMGLLPHPVAVSELEVNDELRTQIKTDVDRLLRDGRSAGSLLFITPCPVDCLIAEVEMLESGEKKKLILSGEAADLELETRISGDVFDFGVTFKNK